MQFIYNNSSLVDKRRIFRKNQTDAEKLLWSRLRRRQLRNLIFHRQYGVGFYILDFYCLKCRLGIELDGGQHNDKKVIAHDRKRGDYLRDNDIEIIRFWNNDVMKNIDGVVERINQFVNIYNPT